jgi:hypothetical protein
MSNVVPDDYRPEHDEYRYACPYDHRAVSMGGDWTCRTCDEVPMYVVDRVTNEVIWTDPSGVDPHDFRVPSSEDIRAMIGASRFTHVELADRLSVSTRTMTRWANGHDVPSKKHMVAFLNVMRDHFDGARVRGGP